MPRSDLWGFTAPWDPRSALSIGCHGGALGVVVSGWVRLDSTSARPVSMYPDTLHVAPGTRRFALVTTYQRDRFHRETIERLGADAHLRARTAGALAAWAARRGYSGLVLDFESLPREDTTALATVIRAIADSAHRRHIRPVVIAIVPTDTLVYASRHLAAADLLLAMLYDEHWATGAPGPIASPAWVHDALALRVKESGGATRLVASFPVYGYLWKTSVPTTVLSFGDAQDAAHRIGAALARDSGSLTLHLSGPDSARIWIADAELLRTLTAEAESAGVHRIALWRLGLEDPAIWRAP